MVPSGIAVGVSTYIPPHNLGEIIDATLHFLHNPEATSRQLMRFVKGPDFPTGGQIINPQDLVKVYEEGKGGTLNNGYAGVYHIFVVVARIMPAFCTVFFSMLSVYIIKICIISMARSMGIVYSVVCGRHTGAAAQQIHSQHCCFKSILI